MDWGKEFLTPIYLTELGFKCGHSPYLATSTTSAWGGISPSLGNPRTSTTLSKLIETVTLWPVLNVAHSHIWKAGRGKEKGRPMKPPSPFRKNSCETYHWPLSTAFPATFLPLSSYPRISAFANQPIISPSSASG